MLTPARLALCLLTGLWLVPPQAAAQEGLPTPGEAIGRIFDAVKLRNQPPAPPDFVTNSRTGGLDYKPLAPTDRENHKKPPAQLEAIDADMASAAARNRAAAAQVAVPDAVAAKPGTAKPRAKPAPKPSTGQ